MAGRIELRPEEIDFLGDLIDYRDRAHLAGLYNDEFLVAFVGGEGDLTHPSLAGRVQVSMRTLRRFAELGLIEIVSKSDAALAFDLPDDARDRHARLKGQKPDRPAVFISFAEAHKDDLARPLQAFLSAAGIDGLITSDLPQPAGTFGPEEKVDAYLRRSEAIVVLATADLWSTGGRKYPRLNIADEIARARAVPELRTRICVLKEPGAHLQSNVNPVYERLDPSDPSAAFERALAQLVEWGVAGRSG